MSTAVVKHLNIGGRGTNEEKLRRVTGDKYDQLLNIVYTDTSFKTFRTQQEIASTILPKDNPQGIEDSKSQSQQQKGQRSKSQGDRITQQTLERVQMVSQSIIENASTIQIDLSDIDQSRFDSLSQRNNLTEEQKEMFVRQLSDQDVLLDNLRYVNPNILGVERKTKSQRIVSGKPLSIDQSPETNRTQIVVAGKPISLDNFKDGISKIAQQISQLEGNLTQPTLSSYKTYRTKNQPFSKVVKQQEQTKFKPTLGQLFQTRTVIC